MNYFKKILCFLVLINVTIINSEVFVIEANGLGVNEEKASLNALTNLKSKYFSQVDGNETISPFLNQMLIQSSEYEVISSQEGMTNVVLGLTQSSFDNIYQLMYIKMNVDIDKISIIERSELLKEGEQYIKFLQSIPLIANSNIDENIAKINTRMRYYSNSLQQGYVTFPDNMLDYVSLTVDSQRKSINSFYIEAGSHKFKIASKNYYPIEGDFFIKKTEVKNISPPLILIPDSPLQTAVKSNFNLKNRRYLDWLLKAYGWELNPKSSTVFEVNLESSSVPQNNELVEHHIQIALSVSSKTKDNNKDSISIINENKYISQFNYSRNNRKAVPREERLLVIKALLRFLSNFDQESYNLIYLYNNGIKESN